MIDFDKIFKAYDVRAKYPRKNEAVAPDMLTEEAAWKIGHAAAQFLKQQSEPVQWRDTVVVGRDMRPSSPSLAKALCDGIRAAGLNVIDIGMIDTSMIYFAINHLGAIGGIQTTASHNPIDYNGFKISGPKARPIGSASGLDQIKELAKKVNPSSGPAIGTYHEQDLWEPYRAHVLKFLDLKRPLRVAIDASNGMAGKMVPAVFGQVPKLTIEPLLFEITGRFAHEPNPLVEANLDMLKAKIRAEKPDLGACFDGDADRCVFLEETGRLIGSDLVTALLARDFLQAARNKGSGIVYDLRSSRVVVEEIKGAGGTPRRDRVGHAFIKKTMSQTNAVFGGELSGHFYFRDNFFADSGAIAFARLLTVLSGQPEPLSQLVAPLRRYSQSGEINFRVPDKDAKIRELAAAYPKAEVDYLDGITVNVGDWWFNVRQSNTEPLLRLNLEASSARQLDEKLVELQRILGQPAHGH
jgi:phosphomannomutase